jgi:hypothetical protein
MIMNAFLNCGGVIREDICNKLLCFGVDGILIFQRGKMGVTGKKKIHGHHFLWVFILLFRVT